MSKESLSKAIRMSGGQARLAEAIRARIPGSKISQAHISGWLNQVKIEVPPPEVVLQISAHLGYRLTPHDLRGDLYPNPTDALPIDIAKLVDCGVWPPVDAEPIDKILTTTRKQLGMVEPEGA